VTELKTAIADSGLTRPFWSAAERLDLERVPIDRAVTAMRKMVRGLEYDICEMAFVTYLSARAAGVPVVAVPVFVTRGFHHRAIVVRADSGISAPKDLEGKPVLLNRGYTVTTNVWARGVLAAEHGVTLDRITWLPTDEEHVMPFRAPANVDYRHKGEDPLKLLLSGAYMAAVGDIRSDDPALRPLIANPRQAGLEAYRKTGVFPVNHTVVIKSEVLKARPALARELYAAFARAKADYLARLESGSGLEPADKPVIELRRDIGDPYPFGVEANRKAIETVVGYAAEQGVIPRPFGLSELFPADTLDLV
jgi:4,5-dihydroxyphthalate decarboxylase